MGYQVVRIETLEICRDERGQIVSIDDQPISPSLAIDPKKIYTPNRSLPFSAKVISRHCAE
jgi:hypothetical protein